MSLDIGEVLVVCVCLFHVSLTLEGGLLDTTHLCVFIMSKGEVAKVARMEADRAEELSTIAGESTEAR